MKQYVVRETLAGISSMAKAPTGGFGSYGGPCQVDEPLEEQTKGPGRTSSGSST